MESFSADWLALREPADHAARAHALTEALAMHLAAAPPGARALDLAAGSGSNVRYLYPRLPAIAHWTLVDHDAALLARAWRLLTPVCLPLGRSFDVRQGDLNDIAALPMEGCALVTASALLDLVSEAWLRAFARRCREAGVAVLCALSYDGRIDCTPPDRDDELVRRLVNQHQRTDKGFGPALGPEAATIAEVCFRAEGFEVRTAPSDWMLDAHHAELQRQLIEGWAGAAREIAPPEAAAIDAWKARRLAAVVANTSRLRVGHVDLVAMPR
jgi:SAM-dependent methyltransferase